MFTGSRMETNELFIDEKRKIILNTRNFTNF
jgi:hypothetical protein